MFPGCPRSVRLRSGSPLAARFLVCRHLIVDCGREAGRERRARAFLHCSTTVDQWSRWVDTSRAWRGCRCLANVEATDLTEPDSERSRAASLCQSAEPSLLTGSLAGGGGALRLQAGRGGAALCAAIGRAVGRE
jgi:hypothetical protein